VAGLRGKPLLVEEEDSERIRGSIWRGVTIENLGKTKKAEVLRQEGEKEMCQYCKERPDTGEMDQAEDLVRG